MFSPEVAEPSTSTAAIFGPFTHLKPQHILTNGKETSEKRADDVCSDSSGRQESLLHKLSSDVKRIRKEKEESFTKFSKMTKELIMLQKTAMSVKITSSMEAEAVFALLEKPKPPEPKPQKPQRMMGRRGQLSEPKPQATEPPPETNQQPVPAPTPSLAPEELPADEPPIERPTPTPTPKPVPTVEGLPEKPKIERPTIRVNRPLFYPLNPSTPPQPAPMNSATPTPQPASTPILNGGINGSDSSHESPLSTPPVAINKGKRRAAATTAAVAVSANSVTERPEKRPKRDVKKKLISKQTTKVVKEAEETYCSCERISFGEMVACDNENCSIQWFHFECVQLTVKPKGKWFCPDCRQPDNERLPRSTTPQPIMKSLPVSIMKSEQDLKAYPHPAQAQA